LALNLCFKGVSLRKNKDHLKQFHGIIAGHTAIYRRIEKYVGLMKSYVAYNSRYDGGPIPVRNKEKFNIEEARLGFNTVSPGTIVHISAGRL
jgi:hypothetical protein